MEKSMKVFKNELEPKLNKKFVIGTKKFDFKNEKHFIIK